MSTRLRSAARTIRLFPLLTLLSALPGPALAGDEAVRIGSRRELFVDDLLIGELSGAAERRLHQPQPQEVVLTTDEPWEGNTCAYYTIFQDGDLYRMYYRGSHYDVQAKKSAHPEVTCYAESRDGVHWTKPELGLFEFEGSKQNNIVWNGIGTHDFTPFKDTNPDCDPAARYKAFGRGKPRGRKGLYAFQSPDGIHWKAMADEPVITRGAFDSQNLAFWDPVRKLYVDYHRGFRGGVRDIMTCTSKDFLNWTEPVYLEYTDGEKQHLYTNAIRRYERAPQLLIGFPTRYFPKGSRVEPILMSSRDGRTFDRWNEPVIPQTAPEDRAGNRSNYMTWGLVQLPGKPDEFSVYATEAYYTGPDSRVRRFTFRVDGFVSVHAPADGGELLTKPLVFDGKTLSLNVDPRTDKGGEVRVELQDADGKPIPGFTLSDCKAIRKSGVDVAVRWGQQSDLSRLAGKPVRVRFNLTEADLYALRFAE